MVWLLHTLVVLGGFPVWESDRESMISVLVSVRFVRFIFAQVWVSDRSFACVWARVNVDFLFFIMALTCTFTTRPGVSGGVKTQLPSIRMPLGYGAGKGVKHT